MLSNNADDMIRCDEILQHTGLIDSEFEECMKMVQDKLREANTWLMDAQQRLMD